MVHHLEFQNITDPDLGELLVADQPISPTKRQDGNVEDDLGLTDVTVSIIGETEVSYPFQDVPSAAYNTTDDYELVPLVDSTASLTFATCCGPNIYVVSSASDSLEFCSKTWSLYNDLLVGDAAGRILHLYRNTMSKVGVSRVRVSDGHSLPGEATPIVFASKRRRRQ